MLRSCRALGAVLLTFAWVGCKTNLPTSMVKDAPSGADSVNDQMGRLLIDNCKGCHHSTNFYKNWLAKWSPQTKATATCLAAATDIDGKLGCLAATDVTGKTSIGLYRAYLDSAEVNGWITAARSTLPQAQQTALDQRVATMRSKLTMTPMGELTDDETKDLIAWIGTDAALAYLNAGIEPGSDAPPPPAPTCDGQLSPAVRQHIVDDAGHLRGLWATKDLAENGMSMFACQAGGTDPAASCFQDQSRWKPYKVGDKEIRVSNPPPEIANYRIILLENYATKGTTYWTRSSPDGRFVGNGVELPGTTAPGAALPSPIAYGIVDDLARGRTIKINASYDPGFTPDGQWFTFHGWFRGDVKGDPGHVVFCPTSLLSSDVTEIDPGTNPRCIANIPGQTVTVNEHTPDEKVIPAPIPIAEYHSVATSLDQPIELVAQGGWQDDNGGNLANQTTAGYDGRVATAPAAFGDNKMDVYAFDNEQRTVRLVQEFKSLGNQGDFMVSPSGTMVFGRFGDAATKVHAGYKVHLLTPQFTNGQVTSVTDTDGGTLCTYDSTGKFVFGSAKIQYSFDERFIVTHHFNPTYTPTSDNDIQLQKSSSDIWIYDLYLGKAYQLTSMPAGVYALYPHFRADGWLYFTVRVRDGSQTPDSVVATDAAIFLGKAHP